MYSSIVSALLLGLWPGQVDMTPVVAAVPEFSVAAPLEPLQVARKLSASGVVILDAESGQMMYERGANTKRAMASITKLMTALIIVENHDLERVITIPEQVEGVVGNKAYLDAGERYTIGDLVSALLISSANDAAFVLASEHSGSMAAFAEDMNARAKQLGLHDTSFANPSGLDHPQQYSTPRDVAWLTAYVLRNEEIANRMQRSRERIQSYNGQDITLYHTHALLKRKAVRAGKTGTTDDAKECLVSVVDADDRELVVVLMHSDERYNDLRTILAALGKPRASTALSES